MFGVLAKPAREARRSSPLSKPRYKIQHRPGTQWRLIGKKPITSNSTHVQLGGGGTLDHSNTEPLLLLAKKKSHSIVIIKRRNPKTSYSFRNQPLLNPFLLLLFLLLNLFLGGIVRNDAGLVEGVVGVLVELLLDELNHLIQPQTLVLLFDLR